jgi:colanic acid/amylovoran biosynthesis glycosyltransferase
VVVSFPGADAQVDLDRPIHRALTQRMLEKATLLLVRSESLADRLTEMGAPSEKIRIHRAGVPLEEIVFRQREAPLDGAWHCVQACRLIAKKGLGASLRAFAEFWRRFPEARFTIAGEGPQRQELESMAACLGIAERVEFSGFLSQEKLRELYARAHFFLHPSEIGEDGDQEGVPNSMLEAMAAGLAVVATLHGGIPEAVENGVSGLLTPERDSAALAESLFALADDPERYARMSASAAARAASQFDLKAQSRVLEAHYREAIALRGARSAS